MREKSKAELEEDGLVDAPEPFDPAGVVATEILHAALPSAVLAAVRRHEPKIFALDVPGSGWLSPIATALRCRFENAAVYTPADMVSTPAKGRSSTIVRGPTFVVLGDPMRLPPELIAGADVRIPIRPTARALRRALRKLYGARAVVRPSDFAGLDGPEIFVAMRPGSTPREVVARWRRIAVSLSAPIAADRTPLLRDLAGYGDAKSPLLAIADDIHRVRDGKLSGAELPSLLLHGKPGTGKTLLARSLAKSVGLPLVQTSIGDWFSGERAHLGTVIGQARQFFERATSAAPCVALIDELDALPDRMHLEARDRDWWTPIITMVLLSIDRIRATSRGVVLIGATNHYRHLDEALVRPGRFDIHLEITGPTTEQDFSEILRQHLNGALPDADLSGVARAALARGATGAVVESWVRAARERARSKARDLILVDLVEQATPAPDRSPDKELTIAHHEAAHAVVGRVLGFKVRSVTLVREGAVAGKASFTEDDAPTTKAQIEAHVVCGLAGRAADELLNGAAEGGAIGDLHTATGLVAATHAAYGLQGRLSSVGSIEDAVAALKFDRRLAGKVEADMQRLMGEARRLVALHRGAIRSLAGTLVTNRVITQVEVDEAIAADPASRVAAIWRKIVERVTDEDQDGDADPQLEADQGPGLPEGDR
ncbi:MAG: hypothetical protein DI534_11365 [Leifsonia xyli]|nr:MAG: hypothetical protein DI534_11365 [Leifsonia xyli]